MKKIVTLFVAMALCLLPSMANTVKESAQADVKADTIHTLKHYKFWDNWFLGIHGGANHSISENARFDDFFDMTGYGFGLSLGKYFSPSIGARLQFNYMKQHGRANTEAYEAYPEVFGETGEYGFNNFSGYADVLFNLTNLFSTYKETRRFNIIALLGVGFNTTFNFDDKVERWGTLTAGTYPVRTDSKTYFAIRGGFMASYMLSKSLDLTLEATGNATGDGYNGVRDDQKYDGYVNVMLGLVYHFKDHYGDRRFRYIDLSDQTTIDALNAKINEQRALLDQPIPQPVVVEKKVIKNEVLGMTVSFIIDKYNITDIQKKNVAEAAKYLEEHPDINLIVTGYADVQTAYPAYNLKLSQRRAEAVYNMLVKDFNVDPSRIRVDYKGDTVQPYEMKNEWNRVVVFITEPRE